MLLDPFAKTLGYKGIYLCANARVLRARTRAHREPLVVIIGAELERHGGADTGLAAFGDARVARRVLSLLEALSLAKKQLRSRRWRCACGALQAAPH